jgi:anion-transporting  ArsA/GET3 family ATPase
MTELELWKRIARKAYRDDAKALEAYLMTQKRVIWAEEKLAELERKEALRGIEKAKSHLEVAFQTLSAN